MDITDIANQRTLEEVQRQLDRMARQFDELKQLMLSGAAGAVAQPQQRVFKKVEAARFLNCSTSTLDRLIGRGLITPNATGKISIEELQKVANPQKFELFKDKRA